MDVPSDVGSARHPHPPPQAQAQARGTMAPLPEDERVGLLQAQFPNSPEAQLRRFARARPKSVDAAAKMHTDHLRWREGDGRGAVLAEAAGGVPDKWVRALDGRAPDGSPVIYTQVRPRPPGCIRREGASEAAPGAVRQAVGGGCQSGWGRLLSVTNAIEAGSCRQGNSGWAQTGRPGRGGYLPPL